MKSGLWQCFLTVPFLLHSLTKFAWGRAVLGASGSPSVQGLNSDFRCSVLFLPSLAKEAISLVASSVQEHVC